MTAPIDRQEFVVGQSLVVSGTITGGSPPFVLEVDLYDNRRFHVPLGDDRDFSFSWDLNIPTTTFAANLIQVSSGDGQIDHLIRNIMVHN